MSGFKEHSQVCVVNASAGSGKTYALAKRYVQILLVTSLKSPQSLKQILAITFTNKAAAQMKERIITLVKRIALGKLSGKEVSEILDPLGMDAPQAKQAAGAVMEDIIRYYHYFNVQTIDSFMNTLLAGCAFKIGLSAKFKIERDSMEYLLLSLDSLIDKSHLDPQVKNLFERFISQYLFLENRGNWFPKDDLLLVIKSLFKQNNTFQKALLPFAASDKDVHVLKKQMIGVVGEVLPLLPPETDKRFINALKEFHEAHTQGFDIDVLSRYFSREEIPVKNGAAITSQCVSKWKRVRSLLNQIVLCESYSVFNPYIDLYDGVMRCLSLIQKQEDIIFLEELNKKAGELFTDDLVSISEVYYRLATRFDHYLIDEFQDTAQAQWQNIKPLVEESLSHGGSLFYVGDKKQAIYGFRGGKSLLFDQLPSELKAYAVKQENLEMNYRSRRFVVEFNNEVFAGENLMRMVNDLQTQDRLVEKDIVFTDEDRRAISDVFAFSRQQPKDGSPFGRVRVEMICGKLKEERTELTKRKVIEAIEDCRKRHGLKHISVLARNNSEVEEITGWLMENRIPARSERTSDIKNHWLIRDMMALLRFLSDTSDNAAFADFITSPLFLKAAGESKEAMEAFLFENRPTKTLLKDFAYHQSFKQRFDRSWEEYFAPYLLAAGIYPLYEMALSICRQLNVLQAFPEEQGFVMHWLELIKLREEKGCDLDTFLGYFDALEDQERFVPMPSLDAVSVLTIHKAKGLEYACVIIPFLEMSIKVGAGDKSGGQSFLWDETPEGLRMFRLKDPYTRFCPLLKDRYAYEFKQSFMAELNTMYVALTRAVEEMVVFIPERTGNSANAAALLIPEKLYTYGQVQPAPAVEPVMEEQRLLPPADIKPWIGGWSEELTAASTQTLRKRRQGEIVHYCLGQIKNMRAGDFVRLIQDAVDSAAGYYKISQEKALYEQLLYKTLSLPQWKRYFELPQEAKVFCEMEIVNAQGQTRRIDRVIVMGDQVSAVDFKPQGDLSGYKRQMEDYQQLLTQLYPQSRVSVTILTYEL